MKKTLLLNFFKAATSRNPRKNTTRFNGLLALFLMVMLFGMNGVMGQVTIASQDFESTPGTPTLSFTNTNGAYSTGTNGASGSPANSNLYVSGARGWQSVNTTSTLTFANQSLIGYTNAFVDFRLAGMSVNSGNGIDGADLVTVSISVDGGTTYSSELTIGGVASNQKWDFTANGTSTITYDGNNTPTAITSSTSGGISTVTINIPNVNTQVSVRIAMLTNDPNERYVIDDVRVRGTVSSSPTISVGTLNEFSTTAINTPSVEQTLVISGSNLTNDISIVPPTGFEISTNTGGGFSATNPITLTQLGGTVANTNIYVRYNPASLTNQPQVAGTNISVTSTGATTQNVTVLGSVRNLSQGDFAVIGFNCSSTDAISFVALTSIPANTIIKFTDNGYSDATTQMLTEGYLIYTAPSTISAGTVVSWNNGMNISGTGWNSNAPTNFNLNASGEQLFAFQGTWGVSGGTTTLHQGFMTGGTWTTTGSVPNVAANSYLPTGLTTGTNAADFANANAYYTNNATNTVNTRSTIFTRSSTAASWTTNGSLISTPAWVFNIIADEPTTQPSFSSATSVGNNQMSLNFSGGNGTSYMVVMREGSAVSATPTDATNYSLVSGSVNFASATELSAGQKIVYNGTTSTGTVTITNLSAGTTYYYSIYAYNGTTTKANFYLTSPGTGNQLTTGSANSNVSDIIIHSSFTEPNNIAYASTQENSNLIVGNSVEVAQFSLRDGGATTDADANSTTLNAITFTIANHTNLRRLALYDGSTELSEVAISSGTATFSGLTLAAGDNLTKDFSLRASFAGTVTDNSQFSFTVSSVTADIAGSTFATADAGAAASSTTGDRNKIEVTADRLTFIQQTSNVSVNTIMSPAPTVSANDALANRDLDYVTDMTATTTGTFGSSTNQVTPVAGLGAFSNLQFSSAATGRTIAVSSGSLTASGNSNTFDITSLIMPGDIAFLSYKTDNPDGFSIITFVDIPVSQTFYFTENAWTTASGPLASNESTITWTTPSSVIPAGTVINFSNPSLTSFTVTPSGNGSAVSDVAPTLSTSGDQLLMFRGSNSTTPTAFICGVSSTNWISTGSTTTNTSYLPSDLSLNINGITFSSHVDNGYYSGPQSGSISTIKALVNNGANWLRSGTIQTLPTWSFALNASTTTLSANSTVQNLNLGTGEVLVIGANTLTINGAVSGSGTFKGGSTSNLTTTGSAGTLYFDQTTPGSTNVLKNFTISSGSATLGNALNITAGLTPGVLSVGTSSTLTTGGNLTLKSNANGTARVSEVGASGAINGNVTVERYIPAKRAWRALTSPLKGSTNNSIFYNWQNNGSVSSGVGVELWGPAGTGTSGNNTSTSGLANGPGASIKQYGNGWSDVTDTKTTSLFTTNGNNAYMVFVTGGYGSGNISSGFADTTLKSTGQLITGPVSYTGLSSTYHTLIGNPYASPIHPSSIVSGATNLFTNVWVWDPALSTNGGYVNYDGSLGAGTYSSSGGSYTNSTIAIQSGQAFFVRAASGTGSLTLTESMKSSSISNTFRNSNSNMASIFRVGFLKQTATDWMPLDGCIAGFYEGANAAADDADGKKMINTGENIGFVRNAVNLSSEHYPLVTAQDILYLKVWNTQQAHYKLKLNTEEFTMTGVEAWLQDLYTGTSQPLNLDGSAQDYEFDVDPTVSASSGNRFRIVFTNTALAVTNPEQGQLSIYPNPATGGKVTVSLPTGNFEGCSYELINVLGQVVRQDQIENGTTSQVSIPITGLPNSWYALRITKDNSVLFQGKLIIKN